MIIVITWLYFRWQAVLSALQQWLSACQVHCQRTWQAVTHCSPADNTTCPLYKTTLLLYYSWAVSVKIFFYTRLKYWHELQIRTSHFIDIPSKSNLQFNYKILQNCFIPNNVNCYIYQRNLFLNPKIPPSKYCWSTRTHTYKGNAFPEQGGHLNIKMLSYQHRDSIIKTRRSHNRLIFIMGIPIPRKEGLYVPLLDGLGQVKLLVRHMNSDSLIQNYI